MNEEYMYWNKGYWDEEEEPSIENNYLRLNVSKVIERMAICELSVSMLAGRIGLSGPLTLLMLKLEICPADKIDILASSLSIDKGELFP